MRIFFFIFLWASPTWASMEEAVPALRQYCKACHSFGAGMFLIAEDDYLVWDFIHKEKAPSGKIWIDSMKIVLKWPTSKPPAPEAIAFETKRYMPLGAKRYAMVADVINNKDARVRLLEALN